MKRQLVVAAVAGLTLTASACSPSSGDATGQAAATQPASPAAPSTGLAASASPSLPPSASASARGASGPVGPHCADYATAGTAKDPVLVAASKNPRLTKLVAAVSGKLNPEVDFASVLDGGQFTVFAPVDSAFAQLPAATLAKLKSDAGVMTKVLAYHVLPSRVSPSAVVGQQKTIEGGALTITGTPGNLSVNGAQVLCGGVQTANATLYFIDGVLTPTDDRAPAG
jgi:uncharacterized surface protein with fasciclin (FAS1) repeats